MYYLYSFDSKDIDKLEEEGFSIENNANSHLFKETGEIIFESANIEEVYDKMDEEYEKNKRDVFAIFNSENGQFEN